MVEKEVFEWMRTRQKTIELRRGRAREGDSAVFQCGRNIIRRKIREKKEGSLHERITADNYNKIIPVVGSLQEALEYFKHFYKTTEGTFTAYYFNRVAV